MVMKMVEVDGVDMEEMMMVVMKEMNDDDMEQMEEEQEESCQEWSGRRQSWGNSQSNPGVK